MKDLEEKLELLLKQMGEQREDINVLAQYTKTNLEKIKELIKSLDGDLKSLESDILKKLNNLGSTSSSDVTYIKELISDDFKEMQTSLLEQIEKILIDSKRK